MDDIGWTAEMNDEVTYPARALATAHPSWVMGVIAAICSASFMDGFTNISTPRLVAETGVAADLVEQVILELIGLDVVGIRGNDLGERILEPRPCLRRMYISWSER